MAKFGAVLVEAVLPLKLGGVPVASKVANRFEEPDVPEIKLDICVKFSCQIFPNHPDSSHAHGHYSYDKISDGACAPSENVTN
jgi:hypothetical protein